MADILDRFVDIVGAQWVIRTDYDLLAYQDIYPFQPATRHRPLGAVGPANVAQLQAVVRLANATGTPIWPISRGKNFGYGGAAPVLPGTVIIDLTRMNRIIEVNEKLAYCVIEPGVGFYDLQDYIDTNGLKLWLSSPGQASGSVMGNALEHGNATTAYGDHAAQICGLEVMLANGDIVRTGMGAMEGSPNWHIFKHGFGPGWDQLFTQSNFAIVIKMGLWLQPEPEATLILDMELPDADDLGWIVDTLAPMRTSGLLRQVCSVRNFMRAAAMQSQRDRWTTEPGALSDSAIARIKRELKIGWWNVNLRIVGADSVNRAVGQEIEQAFSSRTDARFNVTRWQRGEDLSKAAQSRPGMASMQMMNWTGGRGGHVTFSPVLPLDGSRALDQFRRTRTRMAEFGFDYYGSIFLWERSLTVVSQIFFDQDDADMVRRLNALFPALISDARQHGYGEYRTHIDFMDAVATTFDFNNHALARMNQALKAALDPKGIIAPGKQGIWPVGTKR